MVDLLSWLNLNTVLDFLPSLPTIQKIADILWKLIASAGVLIGGIWAYFKFIKGRTFQPNIVPKVAGEARDKDGEIFLIATTEVENVGASKVTLDHQHTVIRVLTSRALARGEEGPIEWGEKAFATRKILQHRDHLEPGGTAVDTELFQIQNDNFVALRLEVLVASTKDDKWTGVGIVNLSEGVDNTIVSGEGS